MMHLFLLPISSLVGISLASDALDLTHADFDSKIADKELVLVDFYSPSCTHCQTLAPEFEQAATQLLNNEPPITLAKVDCTTEIERCQEYGVTGLPALKIFRRGEFSAEYDGPLDAEGIVRNMQSQAGVCDAPVENGVLRPGSVGVGAKAILSCNAGYYTTPMAASTTTKTYNALCMNDGWTTESRYPGKTVEVLCTSNGWSSNAVCRKVCGGSIHLREGKPAIIHSPKYPNSSNHFTYCRWSVTADTRGFNLRFLDLSTEEGFDGVQIERIGDDGKLTGVPNLYSSYKVGELNSMHINTKKVVVRFITNDRGAKSKFKAELFWCHVPGRSIPHTNTKMNWGHTTNIVTVVCQPPYTLSVPNYQGSLCTPNGWQPALPKCIYSPPICKLPPVENGIARVSWGSKANKLTVACHRANKLSPPSYQYSVCTREGWMPAVPKCINSCPTTTVANSSDILAGNFSHKPLQVKCRSGYWLADIGFATANVNCLPERRWSFIPNCVKYNPKACPTLHIDNSPTRLVGAAGKNVRVFCNPGFGFEDIGLAAAAQVVCLKSGKWSTVPKCVRHDCPTIGIVNSPCEAAGRSGNRHRSCL